MSLPLSERATAERPITPRAQAQLKRTTLRAFQVRVIAVEQPARETAVSGAEEAARRGEAVAIVENLEPGVNYTWRIAMDTPAGKIVSPAVKTRAPVCPADIVPSPTVPRRKP